MRSRLLAVAVATAVTLGGAATLAAPAHAGGSSAVDITLPASTAPTLTGIGNPSIGVYAAAVSPMRFTAATSGFLSSMTADVGYPSGGFTATVYAADQVSIGASPGLTQLESSLYVGTPMTSATVPTISSGGQVTARFGAPAYVQQGDEYWIVTVGVGGPAWFHAWWTSTPVAYFDDNPWRPGGYGLAIDLDVDTSPVVVALDPATPDGENGWYTSDVTATYGCAAAVDSCPGTRVLATDGELTPSGSTTLDSGATTFDWYHSLKVDRTAPTITGVATHLTPAHLHASLPTTGFQVHWTCSDATSGVATCPTDTYVSGLPGETTASAVATDNAGNTRTGTVTGLVDGVHAPAITIHGVTPNKTYKHGTVLAPTCTAVATLQTPAARASVAPAPTCTGTTAKKAATKGTVRWSYTATATDSRLGGGTSTKSVSWTVGAKAQPVAKATITVTGFPKETKSDRPVIDHRKDYRVTVVIRGADGKVMAGKPIWLHSVRTNKSGTKGTPTKHVNQFHKVHGKWVKTFTPGYSYAGEYRKFGVLAPNGQRFSVVIYVK